MIAARLRELPVSLQRILAVVALAFLCAVPLRHLLVSAVDWLYEQSDWRGEVTSQISRERGLAEIGSRVESQLAALAKMPVWSRAYQADDVTAGKTMRAQLTNLLAQQGAGLATEALPIQKEASAHRVAFRLQGSVDVDGLARLLAAFKQASPTIRVDRIQISAPQTQSATANAAMQVHLEVSALISTPST